jgi:hypothetical protein
MIEHFDPMARKFIEALSQALPETTVQTLYWRYNFMPMTVFKSVTDKARESRLARLSEGAADPGNREELEVVLTDFLAAAIRGPSSLPSSAPAPRPPNAHQARHSVSSAGRVAWGCASSSA